jgi:hypothetical protein
VSEDDLVAFANQLHDLRSDAARIDELFADRTPLARMDQRVSSDRKDHTFHGTP